MLQFWLRSRSE